MQYWYIIIAIFLLLTILGNIHDNPVQKAAKYIQNTTEGKTPLPGTDGRQYYVLADKPKKEDAAKMIETINDFLIKFILALKQKYLYNEKTCFNEANFLPNNEFVPFNESCAVDDPLTDFRIRAVYLLVTRYRPNYLEENQPTSSKDTSWEEGKGKRIALCIREQISGEFKLLDPEIIKFVAIHELTHIAANTLDHPYYFWKVFKFLLIEANKLVGFELVDYANNTENYCGMIVSYNPVHDTNINATSNESRDITEL